MPTISSRSVVQFPHLLAQYLYFRHWTKAVINSNRREGLLRAHLTDAASRTKVGFGVILQDQGC